jgi:hypothetical protein
LPRKVPHGAVAVVGVVVGVLVAVDAPADVVVGVGDGVELRVGEDVELRLGVSVGVAVPMSPVGLLVGVDGHPFNAAETAWMRQSTVT